MISREIGAIRIDAAHALVEVPEAMADRVIRALKATKLSGQESRCDEKARSIRHFAGRSVTFT